MKDIHGIGYIMDSIAIALTVVQSERVFQIIQLIVTILATLLSIIFTSCKLYYWWKDAKKDGQITKEEFDEAKKIIEDEKHHLDNK